jgi:GAF domain-containing protein
MPEGMPSEGAIVSPIRDDGSIVGYLVAANGSARPIDPRERELLEMLADSLAVAIRNSRLYGEVAETKRSLEQMVRSAGDAIISIDRRGSITGWDPAAERIFCCSAREAVGRSLRGMFPDQYSRRRQALTGMRPASSSI